MMAFPTASMMLFMLVDDPKNLGQRELNWEANLQRWRGLVRALEGPRPPVKIKVDDLLSPFDGKPLEYRFDGKQMKLTVSGDTRSLSFPPDSVFEKPKK